MASKKLAEMDFDQFVDNEFGTEPDVSTDDSDTPLKPKSKSESKSKTHKQTLFNLSEDDPEFYNFLLENDKELLEFSEGDSDIDELVSDSCSEDGKIESVSDTNSESDKSIESIVSMETADDEDIEQDAKKTVTKEQVKKQHNRPFKRYVTYIIKWSKGVT